MEIKNFNNTRIISAYSKNVAGNPVKTKGNPGNAVKTAGDNFDKVEFDFERSISAAKTDITAGIMTDAEQARLENLQSAYAGNNLPVTLKQIAETIVG